MDRKEILKEATEAFGSVPDWLSGFPDGILEQQWKMLTWQLGDTKANARDKAIAALGAASVTHCHY